MRGRVRARRAALALVAAWAAAPPGAAGGATAETAPCRVSATLEPTRAFVGQAVVYRAEIRRRHEVRESSWIEPPSFPSFRAIWIPEALEASTSSSTRGHGRVVERRVLFPARPGRLEIPGVALRCSRAEGAPAVARAPGLSIEVDPPPAAGRPPGFAGLVGAVRVESAVEPARVQLGGILRARVRTWGLADLWRLPPPLPPRLDGMEVFPLPPEIETDPTPSRAGLLRVVRIDRYELVPRRAGSFSLPEVRHAYWDPETGRYGEARTAAIAIEVLPAAARTPLRPTPDPDAGDLRWTPALTAAALALAAVLALAVPALGSAPVRRRLARQRDARQRRARLREALARAEHAGARGDGNAGADALAEALRLAVSARLPAAAPGASVEDLRARAATDATLAEALALLADLDRARFGHGVPPDAKRVAEAVGRLVRS